MRLVLTLEQESLNLRILQIWICINGGLTDLLEYLKANKIQLAFTEPAQTLKKKLFLSMALRRNTWVLTLQTGKRASQNLQRTDGSYLHRAEATAWAEREARQVCAVRGPASAQRHGHLRNDLVYDGAAGAHTHLLPEPWSHVDQGTVTLPAPGRGLLLRLPALQLL